MNQNGLKVNFWLQNNFIITKKSNFLGPELPENYHRFGHEIVSNGETVYYVNTVDKVILKLDCPTDLKSCKWTILEQKLESSRQRALAFIVPDELTECS